MIPVSSARGPIRHFARVRRAVLGLVAAAFSPCLASADDADIAKLLKGKGLEITEVKGLVTGLNVQDGSKLTDEDFLQITRLSHLKAISLNNSLNDERVALLATLGELERLQTNVAQVTDEGIKPLARVKSLQTLAFFHPGKSFTGAGLAYLAGLPNLERLTVAGSFAFNDDGMAAVAKLTGLKEFRTWHAGGTDEGVKQLTALKGLKSLYLGQRLTYKPPACPTDTTIGILVQMKSLESLQLDEARLSLAALQQLKQLPSLKKLKLSGIDIPREDIERLRRDLPQVQIEWMEPNETYQKRIGALFGGR